MDDKLHDIQAEAVWLSTAIEHPEFLRSTDSNIKPDFFYDKTNKCLAWAVTKLAIENAVDNIDLINLENVLSSNVAVKRIVENTLGEKGLQDFIENAKYAARPTYEEFKLSEDKIVTDSFKRDMVGVSSSLQKMSSSESSTIEQIDDFCNNQLQDVVNRYVFGSDSCLIGEKMDEIWDEIVSKRTANGYGIPFFLPRLNEFASLVPGELNILLGITGSGKSSVFLAQALYTVFNCGVGVLLIDSELTDDVWLPRALASLSGVPVWKIKTGKFSNKEEEDAFKEAYQKLKKAPLIHYYLPEFSKTKIEQLTRKWIAKENIGLLEVDYLKNRPGHYDAAAISQDLGEQSDALKSLAGRLNISVFAGQQQNEDTRQAADSKKVRRYADTEMAWEEKPEEEVAAHPRCGGYKIEIFKNRNGATTTKKNYIDVNFEKDCMRISQAQMHQITSDIGENPFE